MSSKHINKTALGVAVIAVAAVAGFLAVGLTTGAGATKKATTVTVTAGKPSEFRFELSKKSVATGAVTFKVTNKGAIPHDFKICASDKGGTKNTCTGKSTKVLNPKGTATLTYTFKTKGTYEYLCTVPGHAASGMKGDLKVT